MSTLDLIPQEQSQPGLFPETPEMRIQRVDQEILWLLMGKPGGPFQQTLDDAGRAVLAQIRYRRGQRNAITIREIGEATQLTPRAIKDAVRTLRLSFRLPIAASKDGAAGGYFLWTTREESRAFKAHILNQVRAELEVLHAVIDEEDALDIPAQLRIGGMHE